MASSQPVNSSVSRTTEVTKSENQESQQNNIDISFFFAFTLSVLTFYLFGFITALVLFVPYHFLIRHKKWIYILYRTLPRDAKALWRFSKLNIAIWKFERNSSTVAKVFRDVVAKHPNKIAFQIDDRHMTFQQVEQLSNQVANYFKSLGYKHGDNIALFMESKPEFVCIWLGLSKIGVVTALINTNLRQEPLMHSIKCADCTALIYGVELKDAVTELSKKIGEFKYFEYGEGDGDGIGDQTEQLQVILKKTSTRQLDLTKHTPKDKLIYIYTSGTTGLPKAAVITNLRYLFMAQGVHNMCGLRVDDILYDSLPLYHSAGGILGAGQCLLKGVTVALRKKFSASNYWKDCIKYNCTCAQYIGEICRYLLATPDKPEDQSHKVRTIFGNGLRPQIWKTFVNRFGIKNVCEFYGATEGNSNLVNIDSKIGAVGFVPSYARKVYPVSLVKCDEITGEIIRNAEGLCIRCKPYEPGVFVGKINPKKAVNSFSGYADKKDSEKKILHNVFKEGDMYFNSGDILINDELGYYYFKDRTGDTFRWRGENVATSEVEAVISNVIGLNDCVVYGVAIPNVEGKAGMAAIVDAQKSINLSQLYEGLKEQLPAYARPLFIRVLLEVPMTGTYKLKKRDLQVEGFDINNIKDPIYFLNSNEYQLVTAEIYQNILNGKLRL